MRILIIAAVILISVQGTSHGQGVVYGEKTCSEYLGEYSLFKLSDWGTRTGPTDNGFSFSFIEGVISAHNVSINGDILGEMSINDAYRWIAAFCRDSNPKVSLVWATYKLINHKSK